MAQRRPLGEAPKLSAYDYCLNTSAGYNGGGSRAVATQPSPQRRSSPFPQTEVFMKRLLGLATGTGLLILAMRMFSPAQGPPAWAYGTSPTAAPAGSAPATPAAGGPATAVAPDTSVKKLPGSSLEFTRAQITDGF